MLHEYYHQKQLHVYQLNFDNQLNEQTKQLEIKIVFV